MCVIVYKPKGQDLPSDTILKNCFSRNKDGAGFMFHSKGKVHIQKGLMDYKTFESALDKVKKTYDVRKMAMVLHFRITTQGGTNQACTHPFPLSSKMEDLRLLNCNCDIGVAHNGIISLTTTYSQVDYSDTMKFITDYLSLIIRNKNYHKSKNTLTLIERLVGSKLAIMDGDGHVELIGNFIEENGIYYSNSSYLQPKVEPKTTYLSNYGYGYGSNNKYSQYNTYNDYWERWYDDVTGEYDFDDSYCPVSIEKDHTYCMWCANYGYCKLTQNIFDESSIDIESIEAAFDLKNSKEFYLDDDNILHVIAFDEDDSMYDVEYEYYNGEWEPIQATLIEDSKNETEEKEND